MRSALLAFSIVGLACADPLPDGLRLEQGKGRDRSLYVARGKERGRVPVPERSGVSALKRVRFDRKGTVTLDYLDGCEDARKASWSVAALKARLENAIAFRQLAAAKLDAAIAGFRKAVALDGTLDVARTNLASALVRAGDRAGSLTALQPLLDGAPAATYAKIAADPDLAPLLEAAPIARLRAAHRGTVAVTAEQVLAEDKRHAAFVAATSELVAVGRVEASSGDECDVSLHVTILRASDGAVVTELPLGGLVHGAHDRCVATRDREAHVLIANRVLEDLGFETPSLEVGVLGLSNSGDPKVVFERAKLGVVETEKATRVLSGDRVVMTAPALAGKLELGVHLPAQHLLVLGWQHSAREGCESTDLTGFGVLRVP